MQPLSRLLAALLALATAGVASAADPPKPAGPVCALLAPEKLPHAALLEAKLLADSAMTWVDRSNIDAVLKEQQIQAVFSPQGVGDRVRLGKLLKADVLVMVRPAPDPTGKTNAAKNQVLEVVVSETAGGLRRFLQAVPGSASTEADVAALAAAVRKGVQKAREPVKGVVAVPPFVGQDLAVEFDHLKWAYAKLAEGVALGQPGVVVVELAEAEALARELAVAAPGSRLARPAPVYLMGEYRHEGQGAGQTVTLKVRAEQGGKAVGEPASLKQKPAEAPAALQKWAAGVLGGVVGNRAVSPADAKGEAKLLAARAQDFERLANWSESLALVEAAILLDPDSPELRAAALPPITQLISQEHQQFVGRKRLGPDAIRLLHRLQNRGLSHLEVLITRDDDLRTYKELRGPTLAISFLARVNWVGPTHRDPSVQGWPREQMGEIFRERQATMLRLIPRLTGPGEEMPFVRVVISYQPPRERYGMVERLILQRQDDPNTRSRTLYAYLQHAWNSRRKPNTPTSKADEEEVAECRAVLARLAQAKNPEVRAAVQEFGQYLDNDLKPVTPEKLPEPEGIRFPPLELVHQSNGQRIGRIEGIRPIGPGVDVVWDHNTLYLMKEKGKLRPVWTTSDPSLSFYTACFDGRYVWVATRRSRRWPVLLVLDPVSEKVWEVSGADGLPQGSDEQIKSQPRHLEVAPLEPGRACVAGSFGRAWVATVTLDAASGKAAVKVIHEAREAQTGKDADEGLRAAVEFTPVCMFTVTSRVAPGGKAERRVLLWRGPSASTNNSFRGAGNSIRNRPLVIDPDTPAVTVLPTSVSPEGDVILFLSCFSATGTTIFTIEKILPMYDGTWKANLIRIGMPDLDVKRSAAGGEAPRKSYTTVGAVCVDGDRVHYTWAWKEPRMEEAGADGQLHREWWTVKLDGTAPRRVGVNVPLIFSVSTSSHYGLVAFIRKPGSPLAPHLVEFTEPPKK